MITNFFHGCVFALVNARPFVSALADYRVNKVRDLIARVGAERRLVSGDSPPSAVAAALDDPLELAADRRHLLGVADHLHPEGGDLDERVERHHRQDRVDDANGVHAVDADQPCRAAGRGIVGVDHGDLVAVAHRPERMQKVRSE